jgi:DNA uptake protein ComE-like DNA-binding protein
MPIFYDPQYGMPTSVPEGREKDFLAQGYRREPPPTLQIPPATNGEGETEQAHSPVVDNQPPGAGFVLVNSASLKELTERLGLSTAQAKDLQTGRPYKTIEDLIGKISGVAWVTLDSQISYQVNTKEVPPT